MKRWAELDAPTPPHPSPSSLSRLKGPRCTGGFSVGLARLLDARVAALSPPSRWVEALSQSHDVLHLSVGDTSQLKVNGALPQTLDLKAIRALLPALVVFWTDDGDTH